MALAKSLEEPSWITTIPGCCTVQPLLKKMLSSLECHKEGTNGPIKCTATNESVDFEIRTLVSLYLY